MDLDVCLIERYQGISVEVLPNGSHVLPPSHHILTVSLEQQACLFKLHPTNGQVCSTCIRPSAEQNRHFIDVNCTVSCQIHENNNKFTNGHNICIHDLTTKS